MITMMTQMMMMMIRITVSGSHLCVADAAAGESESPDCWTDGGVVTMETCGDCGVVSMVFCWHVCGGR